MSGAGTPTAATTRRRSSPRDDIRAALSNANSRGSVGEKNAASVPDQPQPQFGLASRVPRNTPRQEWRSGTQVLRHNAFTNKQFAGPNSIGRSCHIASYAWKRSYNSKWQVAGRMGMVPQRPRNGFACRKSS
jgi:hypothetical protein